MSKASFLFFFFTLTFDFFSNNSRICVSKRNNILVICMKFFQTLNRKQILVRRKRTWLCVRRGVRKREKEGRRERGREGGRKEGRKIKKERLWAVERNGREMPWSLERKDWESTRDGTLTYFSEETKDSFFYRLFQNIYFWEEFSRPEILIQSEELDSQVAFPGIAESEAGLQLSLGRN